MAVNTNELRGQRAKLIAENRAILDAADARGESMTKDENERYAKIDEQISALTTRIEREERQLKLEADIARGQLAKEDEEKRAKDGPSSVRYGLGKSTFAGTREKFEERMNYAIQGWFRSMKPEFEPEPEHLEAAKFFNINLRAAEIALPLRHDYRALKKEYRDMSLTAGSGGYTVPEGFVNSLEVSLLAFANVRAVADVIRTTSGNPLPWPTANDTSNSGEIIAEAASIGSSVDPSFGVLTLGAFKYSSKALKVSTELLEDSAFPLASQIGSWLGERIGRIQNAHFTTGTGTTLPKGLMVAGASGKTAAATNAFTADEVIDLQHSVDPAYRGNATWMFHDTILGYIRKLKGSDNNYLWQPGLQAGIPDRLLGQTYTINQQMASALTTGQKLVLYGDMSKYKIRDVREVRFVRLNELYAANDQVGFVAFMRTDGNLLDAGTDPVKWLNLA